MEAGNPTLKVVTHQGILFGIVFPEFNFYVTDFVARNYIGKIKELLQGAERQILIIVEINICFDGRTEASHLGHASAVFFSLERNGDGNTVKLIPINRKCAAVW